MDIRRLGVFAAVVLLLAATGCPFGGGTPNKPAKPGGPDMRGIATPGIYTATTTDPEGDSLSFQFNWGATGDTSAWTWFVASGESVAVAHAWSTAGTYSVTVRARDTRGKVSGWSAALVVTVRANENPATPPMPTGPASGVRNATYRFYATATDPEGDSIRLRFSWGNGDTSAWGRFIPSGGTDSASYTWQNAGVYYISVQTEDKLGGLSDWSQLFGIVITDTAYPYTIALTWGETPRDLDSHIWTPEIEGDSWHIYFGRKGYGHVAPYCSLDVDDVTSYGPEHITITRAFNGEYIYAVHNYSNEADITTSGAVVRVYRYGNLTRTYTIPTEPANGRRWWHVFKLDAVNGTITDINTIEQDPPLPWTVDARK